MWREFRSKYTTIQPSGENIGNVSTHSVPWADGMIFPSQMGANENAPEQNRNAPNHRQVVQVQRRWERLVYHTACTAASQPALVRPVQRPCHARQARAHIIKPAHKYTHSTLRPMYRTTFAPQTSHPIVSVLEHCIPVSSADTRRHLRSASRHLLAVPRFPLNTYGRRAFSVADPMAWNSLPDFIRDEQQRLF